MARDRMSTHWAKGRLHHTKHDRYIGNRVAHRTGCILTVSNRNNSILRNQFQGRFKSHVEVVSGRTNNRTIRFSPDGGRTKICRRCYRRT
jgi:hypothetical protein